MELDIIKDEEIELLLEDVSALYGYDFSQYSRASLKRRLNRICVVDKFASFAELRYRVINDSSYLQRFVEEITVNVTEMFRDPNFYKKLRTDILPLLGTYPFIRIWVAGCSTGEEAYSIAILLQEVNLAHKALIYATDINPSVIEKASKGIFPLRTMKLYSENYINSGGVKDFSSYYTAMYDVVKFQSGLSDRILFSTHNLVSDSSFNEFQLILCRNVLIYFDKDLQNKVFSLFDGSLQKLGYLALGDKETLRFSSLQDRYKQIQKHKIWQKSN
ncbi:CheR-type MCP methyltransferase [Sphingobacterium alimentarium]|uniref:CheR-type MCP methyltransferase n=1 Tax=Sphingobacterium alimentarium TaxID=797292 RepID=A0A4R3VXH9_9SPHI|nr:protein-glutamate O-methyltransferase CheR [Sphingobacterium alimentarium]TCV11554.1 CheR-type MCP methyltransferase [Sphingobacterium alimentarium]